MNGTVIDIPGINVSVEPIELQDSTDKAHVLKISDGSQEIVLTIIYGKITCSETKELKH